MITTTIETITAKLAKEYLAKNVVYERGEENTNRPVSLRNVNQLAVDMLKGNWRVTHQGIGFDVVDHLKDGQHRLLAVVQAAEHGAMDGDIQLPPNPKISIKSMVTRGLDVDIFPYLDMGKNRSAATILTMAGYTNSTTLSAAARLLYLFDNFEFKTWPSIKVTNQTVLDVVRSTGIDQYGSIASMLRDIGFIKPAAMAGSYLAERAYPDADHDTFLTSLADGTDLSSDSPILILRNYMIKSRNSSGVRRDAQAHLALYIKTWNDYLLGRRRATIAFKTSEVFPKPMSRVDIKKALGK